MHLQGLQCKVTAYMSEGRAGGQMAVSTCWPTCMSRLMRTSSLRWKGEMTLRPHTFGAPWKPAFEHFNILHILLNDSFICMLWRKTRSVLKLNLILYFAAWYTKLPVNETGLSDGDSFMFQQPEADYWPLGLKHDVSALSELCIKEADASLPKALYVQHGYTTVCWLSST